MRLRKQIAPQPRQVVLVEFPFSDAEGSKERPAVIISSASYPACENEVIVLMVTSNVERAKCETDCPLMDWREAGLSKPSAVRCRPATIRVELIKAMIGSLTDEDWQRLQECLHFALDL